MSMFTSVSVDRGSTELTPSEVVHPAPWVFVLSALVAGLVLATTLAGLLWDAGDASRIVTSVRGETVELYADGLYRYDTLFKGAANRGTDLVLLVAGVPLLVTGALAYRRRSSRGSLLLAGVLGWVLYVYATLSVGTAYNELFLVYVALFGGAAAAFVGVLGSIDLKALESRLATGTPPRWVGWFLTIAGAFTAVMWTIPIVGGLVDGQTPALLGTNTTLFTEALDLAIIVPAVFVAGWHLLRGRRVLGLVVAVPLLVLLAALAPTVIAQTMAQVNAGVMFTSAEIIGPISGFVVLGTTAGWAIYSMLHGLDS
jgi:hypothetical protein